MIYGRPLAPTVAAMARTDVFSPRMQCFPFFQKHCKIQCLGREDESGKNRYTVLEGGGD